LLPPPQTAQSIDGVSSMPEPLLQLPPPPCSCSSILLSIHVPDLIFPFCPTSFGFQVPPEFAPPSFLVELFADPCGSRSPVPLSDSSQYVLSVELPIAQSGSKDRIIYSPSFFYFLPPVRFPPVQCRLLSLIRTRFLATTALVPLLVSPLYFPMFLCIFCFFSLFLLLCSPHRTPLVLLHLPSDCTHFSIDCRPASGILLPLSSSRTVFFCRVFQCLRIVFIFESLPSRL